MSRKNYPGFSEVGIPMRPDNPSQGLRYKIECPDGAVVITNG